MAVPSKKKKIFDDRYEILSIVGRGSRSVVYHARHVDGDRHEVALKVLLSDKNRKMSGSDLLRKEALAMVSSRHKYVIRLDDFHSVDDLCYLSMEFAPEADLRKYVQKIGGTLPFEQAEIFLSQAAEALNFIHLAGILHRDVKPDNILVVDAGTIRLGDFGVAVLPGEDSSVDELRAGVGTMSYMAPEVLEGIGYDQRADVYALGVSFYEMLTGTHPFEGVPLAQQLDVRKEENFPPLRVLLPKIPEHLAAAIMQALRYDVDERPPTARDLLRTLKEHKAIEIPASARSSAASSPARPGVDKAAPAAAEKAPVRLRSSEKPQSALDAAAEAPGGDASSNVEPAKRKRRRRKRNTGIRTTRRGAEEALREPQPDETPKPGPELHGSTYRTEPPAPPEAPEPATPTAADTAIHSGPALSIGESIVQSAFSPSGSMPKSAFTSGTAEPESKVVEPHDEIDHPAPGQSPQGEEEIPEIALDPRPEPEQPPQRKSFTAAAFLSGSTEPGSDAGPFGAEEHQNPIESSLSSRRQVKLSRKPSEEAAFAGFQQSPPPTGDESQRNSGMSVPSKQSGRSLKPLFLAVVIAVVAFIGYSEFESFMGGGSSEEEAPAERSSPDVQPARLGGAEIDPSEIRFPLLPSGIYHGSVSAIVPGRKVPFTAISSEANDSLTLIVGIPGWPPATVRLTELAVQLRQRGSASIEIASNGIVLKLEGENSEAALSGQVLNASTGEIGEWTLAPIESNR